MNILVTGHRTNTMVHVLREEPASPMPRMRQFSEASEWVEAAMYDFAMERLDRHKDSTRMVFTGLGIGWDSAVATACLRIGIPYTGVVAFNGSKPILGECTFSDIERFDVLCNGACAIRRVVNNGRIARESTLLKKRNEALVDFANLESRPMCMALLKRSETQQTVSRALMRSINVINLYSEFLSWLRDR